MSRTDKDVPDWVTAEWWKPRHICHPARRVPERRYFAYRGGELVLDRIVPAHRVPARECDLPPAPVRNWFAWGWPRGLGCHWEPICGARRHCGFGNPPRWYRLHVGYNVERTRGRSERQAMLKEFRASGTVDTVPNVDQHRHKAGWLWS